MKFKAQVSEINKKFFWIWIAAFVVLFDRLTKLLVIRFLPFEEAVKVTNFFNLFFTANRGVAFSLFSESTNIWQVCIFSIISLIVSITLIIILLRSTKKSALLKVALALILGGALGNFWDRVMYQSVVDFLDFHFKTWHWPAFNIADSSICIGGFLSFIEGFYKKKKVSDCN